MFPDKLASHRGLSAKVRLHELDGLRVAVFGLLILYHTGMLYVAGWDWHYKSQYKSEILANVMLWSNQWRMSLLFFISGAALALFSVLSATRIEVSTDGGLSWQPARWQTPAEYFAEHPELATPGPDALAGAWGVFTATWLPSGPGTYKVGCRAIDVDGKVQQLDNDPNVHGHFNQTRVKWRMVTVPERRLGPA